MPSKLLDAMGDRVAVQSPGQAAPWAGRVLARLGKPVVRLFHRATLEGTENIPSSGRYLLVANHSAGMAAAEIACIASLWADRYGTTRPLAGFAYPAAFHVWPISFLLRSLGAIPSTYSAAQRTLAADIPILVFPGGSYESTRSVVYANSVDFGGRVGFLRIARETNTPIVPMGIRGAHFTAPILFATRWILPTLFVTPRCIGLKRYPVSLLAVATIALIWWSVPLAWPWRCVISWAYLALLVPSLIPWVPWTIRLRVGRPLSPNELFGDDDTDEGLRVALTRVERAVAELVKP